MLQACRTLREAVQPDGFASTGGRHLGAKLVMLVMKGMMLVTMLLMMVNDEHDDVDDNEGDDAGDDAGDDDSVGILLNPTILTNSP